MTLAITGATGHFGRLVIQNLKTRVPAQSIVALARDRAKAADLGVEVREFDYSRPETLVSSLEGVETLLLISSNEIGARLEQHRNVIRAAKEAGVKRIVYTSILRADSSPISLAQEHRATELELIASGVPYTILRNGWYTENYTAALGGAVAAGALIGSAGEGRISHAARLDYAEAAAVVLTTDGHEGQIYELAGDEAATLSDLAAELSRQTGKETPYRDLPADEYAAALTGFGLPPEMAQSIAGWDVNASQGALFDEGHQLSALIGRPTTPLAVSVTEALKPGV